MKKIKVAPVSHSEAYCEGGLTAWLPQTFQLADMKTKISTGLRKQSIFQLQPGVRQEESLAVSN